RLDDLHLIEPFTEMSKVRPYKMDAGDPDSLAALFRRVDAAIDLLPAQFTQTVCRAAIQAGVHVVNTNYAYSIAGLDAQAREAGVTILPESGLDPGIDLIIYGEAGRRFDELHAIHSYCGGIPEPSACDNPLNYKVSWIWEGVLNSTNRDSRMIKNGQVREIPGAGQHEAEAIHTIDFPGLGSLEAIPNGDAVFFTDLLGVTQTIRETGRYSLRWPGWSAFWRPLKRFGFLSEEPVPGLPREVSPRRFLDKLMGPQLQYKDNEKDLVVMVNVFEGLADGKEIRLTSRMLIERDPDTGLMAMSKGVGLTAAIAARMIARGEITQKGVLSPMLHVPFQPFMDRLEARGVVIEEEVESLY
ncbi:MAG: saccharopine dehydrogenase, partial [Desulfobacterales bacterium]|nr:saccharopine dehydrogenase [Desulfobacterales bacterium]